MSSQFSTTLHDNNKSMMGKLVLALAVFGAFSVFENLTILINKYAFGYTAVKASVKTNPSNGQNYIASFDGQSTLMESIISGVLIVLGLMAGAFVGVKLAPILDSLTAIINQL
jgi:hypothetical protein